RDGPHRRRVLRRRDPGHRGLARRAATKAMMRMTRRAFLCASPSAALFGAPVLAQGRARIVVIGGGFAGTICARELQRAVPRATVTLIEANPIFTACPFSNSVIAGLRPIGGQRFGYDALRAEGIVVLLDHSTYLYTQRIYYTIHADLDRR